jgi:glycosyltransferase involved in cell wall biosynthesis
MPPWASVTIWHGSDTDKAELTAVRVALIHYWLLGARGGEKVLEAICRIFPAADIFTLFYDPSAVSPLIRSKNVQFSCLNPLRSVYRSLLPLMPMALEDFDLRPYDLVISSESGPAKGVLTSAKTAHFCYCHTPMRYLWELYPAYRHDFPGSVFRKALLAPFASYLRTWDYASAARVDAFMANSANTKQRIWKTYRRRSRVVHPPVSVEAFQHRPSEGYSLMIAEMVAYKQLDYAIRAFVRNGRKLRIVGSGPEYKSLKKDASHNIEFCGRVNDNDLRDLYAHCDALIVPGEEDFGITMVEALASGKPVIALARGGALEIVGNGCGVLYPEANEAGLENALQSFERIRGSIDPQILADRAAGFSEAAFQRRFLETLARFWARLPGFDVGSPAVLPDDSPKWASQ